MKTQQQLDGRARHPVGWARKALSLGLAMPLLAGLAACENPGAGRFMSIGTAGTGGIYYVLGGAIANEMNTRDTTRQFTAEVTGGSLENVNRVRAGHMEIAMVLAVSAYDAFHGRGDYGEPATGLRAIVPMYPNTTHLLVRNGSGIESVEDLRGRRVSVGAAGSGTEEVVRHLLDASGLTYDDIQPRFLSFSESSAALQDGAIDAAIISVGYPASAVLEATTLGAGHLVPIEGEVVERLQEKYPYYDVAEIPAGVYRGMTEPVATFSTMNWVIGRDDVPADVIENVLDIFSDGQDELIKVHEMARQIDLERLDRAPIPLHPAAEAWRSRRVAAVEAPPAS